MFEQSKLTTCYATFNRVVALLETDHVVEVEGSCGGVSCTLHPAPVTTYGSPLPDDSERFAVVDRTGRGSVGHFKTASEAVHAAAMLAL